MKSVANGLYIINCAAVEAAWESRPGHKAMLNGQMMGPKPEVQSSSEPIDAHEQPMVGLKAGIARPAKQMMTCAGFAPLCQGQSDRDT